MEDIERLHEAREGIDRHLQRLDTLPAPAPSEGASTNGVVRVRVDGEGRVTSIVVSHTWSEQILPAELGPAILEAYLAAGAARLEEWNDSLEEAMALPQPQTRPMPTNLQTDVADIAGGDPGTEAEILGRLLELWTEIETEMDSAIEAVSAGVEREHQVSSYQGEVRVTCSASGGLQDLVLSEAWLRRSHPANIGRLVLATINDAQDAALGDFATTQARAASGTAALSRLGDPSYIARRLGTGL